MYVLYLLAALIGASIAASALVLGYAFWLDRNEMRGRHRRRDDVIWTARTDDHH